MQNRTLGKKCRLYTLRAFITLFVTILLGGAVYCIIITVEVSTNPVSTNNTNLALNHVQRCLRHSFILHESMFYFFSKDQSDRVQFPVSFLRTLLFIIFFDPLPDSLSKCFTTPIQWFHRFSFFSHCLLTNFWMFCVCSEKATRSSWIGQLCADTAELCTFVDDHCSELDFAIVV